MNLAVDIGNSAVKLGLFESGKMVDTLRSSSVSGLSEEVQKLAPDCVVVSTVGDSANPDDYPFARSIKTLFLTSDTRVPLKIDYDTPGTLGVDRVAAAVGAMVMNPNGDSLVIDLGSCITYDMVEKGKFFSGGIISPGMNLRFKSMHQFTRNLPLVEATTSNIEFLGKSTVQAMRSGVLNGISAEMESFILQYKDQFPQLKVFMCGGEAIYFENRLKADIFAVPELVMVGLNRILEYNIGNEII